MKHPVTKIYRNIASFKDISYKINRYHNFWSVFQHSFLKFFFIFEHLDPVFDVENFIEYRYKRHFCSMLAMSIGNLRGIKSSI